jgi:hypothetical protein
MAYQDNCVQNSGGAVSRRTLVAAVAAGAGLEGACGTARLERGRWRDEEWASKPQTPTGAAGTGPAAALLRRRRLRGDFGGAQ